MRVVPGSMLSIDVYNVLFIKESTAIPRRDCNDDKRWALV